MVTLDHAGLQAAVWFGVLEAGLLLHDLDRRHWQAWWRLLTPPALWHRPRWALAIVERSTNGHELVRCIEAGPRGRGALPMSQVPWRGVRALREVASALDVAAVIAVERSALAEVSRQLEAALGPGQDGVEQALVALRACKALQGRGLWTYPALLELLPAPSFEPLQRTFDLLVPDDTALVAYVLEDDRRAVHASLIARKRRGHIDRVTTHRGLDGVDERSVAMSWPSSYPRVLAAVERQIAKPSLGVFLERATFRRILVGPSDQLSRELSAKKVVLDPSPAWLYGLLGGATVAAMANRGAKAFAAMLPSAARERASTFAQRASSALRDAGAHPFALLGFDPIELFAKLQDFYRSAPAP